MNITERGAIEPNDVFRATFVENLELTQDLLAHFWFRINKVDFFRHQYASGYMQYLGHRAPISSTKICQSAKIRRTEIQAGQLTWTKIQVVHSLGYSIV